MCVHFPKTNFKIIHYFEGEMIFYTSIYALGDFVS